VAPRMVILPVVVLQLVVPVGVPLVEVVSVAVKWHCRLQVTLQQYNVGRCVAYQCQQSSCAGIHFIWICRYNLSLKYQHWTPWCYDSLPRRGGVSWLCYMAARNKLQKSWQDRDHSVDYASTVVCSSFSKNDFIVN